MSKDLGRPLISSNDFFLQEITEKDYKNLLAMHLKPEISKFYFSLDNERAIELYFKKIIQLNNHYDNLGYWSIRNFDAIFMGWVAIMPVIHSEGIFHIGYAIDTEYQKKGIAKKAVETLYKYVKEAKILEEVYAITHIRNYPSQKVLRKVGFEIIDIRHYYDSSLNLFWKK